MEDGLRVLRAVAPGLCYDETQGGVAVSAVYNFQNTARFRSAVEQGATFRRRLTLKNDDGTLIDLSGYSARMQVRKTGESASPLISLTTENGRISIDGSAGTVTLLLTAIETETLLADAYIYDLELVSPVGDVQRLLEGRFVVSRNVTR